MTNNYKNPEFKVLTKEEITRLAPQVYTESQHKILKDNYKFIPTYKLIEDMSTLGWEVVDVKAQKNKDKYKSAFSKHLVMFRNKDLKLQNQDGEVVYPQILLKNSHDGCVPFTFHAGLFRLVCSNGLVVADKTFKTAKIRHIKYNYNELKRIVFDMVESISFILNDINKMIDKKITEEQKIKFAKESMIVKLGLKNPKEINDYSIDYKELIKPKRKEDAGSSVWQVFNVIQENIINGGFNYSYVASKKKDGTLKVKTSRKINELDKNIQVNKKLYDMALELV